MRIVKGLQQVDFATPFTNLREMLDVSVQKYPGIPAYIFHEKETDGEKTVTKDYEQLRDDINSFAAAMISAGKIKLEQQQKEHIAVIGANSYPWVIVHNATVFGLGLVFLWINSWQIMRSADYAKEERSQFCLRLCSTRYSISGCQGKSADTYLYFAGQAEKFDEVSDRIDHLQSFDYLLASGRHLTEKKQEFRSLPIDNQAMTAIYFTSGTTALSKGVMLSQHNLVSNVKQGIKTIPLQIGWRALSVLPLHHTFENTVGMYCFWATGVSICINENLRTLARNLKGWNINIILTVPLMISTLYRQIMKNIEN